MTRHDVVCRANGGDPQSFVTLSRQHGEDGWSWGTVSASGFRLHFHVAALVERLAGVPPASIPNVTITTRTAAQIEAEPPLTNQGYGDLCDTQPGVSLSILAPIRHATPERSKFEHWSSVGRTADGLVYCTEVTRFIYGVIGNEIRRFWNEADDRVAWSLTTYSKWETRSPTPSEIWIRPTWQIADPEFLPGAFPEKSLPVIDPDQLADKRDRDALIAAKKRTRRQWESRGYTFNDRLKAWSPPAKP